MPNAVMIIIAVVITLVIAVPVSCLAAINYRKKIVESKIGSAEEKARQLGWSTGWFTVRSFEAIYNRKLVF